MVPVCFKPALQDKCNKACAIPRQANELHRGPDAKKQLRFRKPVKNAKQNTVPSPLTPITDRAFWPNDPVADNNDGERGGSKGDEIHIGQRRPRWVKEGGFEHTSGPADDKTHGHEGPCSKPCVVRVVVILQLVDSSRSTNAVHQMLFSFEELTALGSPCARDHASQTNGNGNAAHHQLCRVPDVDAGEGSRRTSSIHRHCCNTYIYNIISL